MFSKNKELLFSHLLLGIVTNVQHEKKRQKNKGFFKKLHPACFTYFLMLNVGIFI